MTTSQKILLVRATFITAGALLMISILVTR